MYGLKSCARAALASGMGDLSIRRREIQNRNNEPTM
jgi:hypothetical protein